ncbi:SSU ribosomal protein S6E [Staphylothermus marinus F1]|uniref:Small ribosomal subunit protein eS6 n=1 Tax=Staphylothermus marinus (strain ATCC 43588 / DSM 3639 / JCM 9404 / F1) TaxID=399550 RepID=RS6E_STAMF|nr:30S ribosomal protein S6e [Staphylothermus marinus]A3DMS1.1 RecName: Full=Small ribosomal subunit protein eS6; AltName: Full=30S ribosomal protein S6e [Staphylothermus marinus F1]ABN69931.1 SSU ribosomal protein S6E [Staphylothermus marinus F1]
MADFKIVISDPQAPKEETVVKVKVVGDPEIKFDENVKEGFELPILKMNSKTAEKIKAVHGVATIRMYKPGTKDKVKITGKIIVDDNIPENEVRVNAEQLVNATGTNELEGELFRARAWQIRINDDRTKLLIGLKIGDEFDGSIVGLKNVKLKIRGGSDNSGFPMRPDVMGGVKKRVLLSGPPGFHPREKGERRRKMIRGNTITEDIVQINTVIKYV